MKRPASPVATLWPVLLLAAACSAPRDRAQDASAAPPQAQAKPDRVERALLAASGPQCPIPGGVPCDELILPGETHFAHLWRLTWEGQNAEAYWSFAGDRLCFQRKAEGDDCDKIYVTEAGAQDEAGDVFRLLSNGRGATTCSYFLPGDREVLYGSTHAVDVTCPEKPVIDDSTEYTWAVFPGFDVYVQDLATGEERLLIGGEGYDTEATVSPRGDRIVFTSDRSGDLELWTCDLAGGDLQQVTDKLGYDGGAFFSHDGEWLVFRSTQFVEEEPAARAAEEEHYRYLLRNHLVRPKSMEIMLVKADGTERRQVTHLGNANWAPYFFPNDDRIVFSSNHESPNGYVPFNLYAIDRDGGNLERITYEERFGSFPMFSPDGKYLVFGSTRGGNEGMGGIFLYVAEWRD